MRPTALGHNARFPLAYPATWDRAMDLDSARALAALDPATLLIGHGPALREPQAAMASAIERASAKAGA